MSAAHPAPARTWPAPPTDRPSAPAHTSGRRRLQRRQPEGHAGARPAQKFAERQALLRRPLRDGSAARAGRRSTVAPRTPINWQSGKFRSAAAHPTHAPHLAKEWRAGRRHCRHVAPGLRAAGLPPVWLRLPGPATAAFRGHHPRPWRRHTGPCRLQPPGTGQGEEGVGTALPHQGQLALGWGVLSSLQRSIVVQEPTAMRGASHAKRLRTGRGGAR